MILVTITDGLLHLKFLYVLYYYYYYYYYNRHL